MDLQDGEARALGLAASQGAPLEGVSLGLLHCPLGMGLPDLPRFPGPCGLGPGRNPWCPGPLRCGVGKSSAPNSAIEVLVAARPQIIWAIAASASIRFRLMDQDGCVYSAQEKRRPARAAAMRNACHPLASSHKAVVPPLGHRAISQMGLDGVPRMPHPGGYCSRCTRASAA